MRVFDFDKTIYDGDSITHFCWFLARRHITFWPRIVAIAWWAVMYYVCGNDSRKFARVCRLIWCYMPTEKLNVELEAFWQEEWGRVKPWYIKMKKPTDVISTASPDFIVRPVIEKLGVKMIASKVDARGQLVGKNNRREEKVVRWKKEFGAVKIDEFYSDSLKNDAPMAKYALKAYFVKGDKITDWPK